MIKTENLTKTYRRRDQEVVAVDNASLEIQRGDLVSIIGPSGSGKSSVLLVLGGMLSPSSGRVIIDGQSLYDLSQNQRARLRQQKVGFVFQTFNLIPYLTALQNVQLPLLLGQLKEKQQERRAWELLERVGLGNRVHHKPSELSVGQQQRIALARMLANDPEIVLADEPTGNLDPETTNKVLSFLHELNEEGRIVVIVTHDMAVARKSKRIITITEGKVTEG